MYNQNTKQKEGVLMIVRGDILIKTFMETFDHLMENDLFVFKANRDFLASRIRIDESGFVKETQVSRTCWPEDLRSKREIENIWVEETILRVPAAYVLTTLQMDIESVLSKSHVPAHKGKYAYLHDKKGLNSEKDRRYFKSYQQMLETLKQIRGGLRDFRESDGKILGLSLRDADLVKRYKGLSKTELREIECYAKLESELTQLLLSYLGYEDAQEETVEDILKEDVDLEKFEDFVIEDYGKKLNGGKIATHRDVYGARGNPYISDLGLDGRVM